MPSLKKKPQAHVNHENGKTFLDELWFDVLGQPRTRKAACNGQGSDGKHDFPVDVPLLYVFGSTYDCSRNDDCQGRANRGFNGNSKEESQRRHDDDATSYPKKTTCYAADNPDQAEDQILHLCFISN